MVSDSGRSTPRDGAAPPPAQMRFELMEIEQRLKECITQAFDKAFAPLTAALREQRPDRDAVYRTRAPAAPPYDPAQKQIGGAGNGAPQPHVPPREEEDRKEHFRRPCVADLAPKDVHRLPTAFGARLAPLMADFRALRADVDEIRGMCMRPTSPLAPAQKQLAAANSGANLHPVPPHDVGDTTEDLDLQSAPRGNEVPRGCREIHHDIDGAHERCFCRAGDDYHDRRGHGADFDPRYAPRGNKFRAVHPNDNEADCYDRRDGFHLAPVDGLPAALVATVASNIKHHLPKQCEANSVVSLTTPEMVNFGWQIAWSCHLGSIVLQILRDTSVCKLQLPSSITRASSLARIREEEIMTDEVMGGEERGDSYDDAIGTNSLAAPTPATCSTGLTHGVVNSPVAVPLVLWRVTPSSKTPPSAAPTPPQWPSSVLELDTMGPTRCSTLCFDDDIGVLKPTFQPGVTPRINERGQVLRPSPWPSFIDEHTSIAPGAIVEPPPSATMPSKRVVVPCSSIEVTLATTDSKVLQFLGYLLNSRSVMWCLDDVFWRRKKCWSYTQYVQPASTFFAAHNQFLETSEVVNTELKWEAEFLFRDLLFGWYTELKTVEWHFSLVQPAHLDCLRPPPEPPDSSEGCETILSYAHLILRGVKGISHDIPTTEFVFNCYSLVVRNAYSSDSTVCNAITNLEDLSLKFASTAEYSCYIIIHSKWWVLLVTRQGLIGGSHNIRCVQPTNAIGDATLGLGFAKQWDTRMVHFVPVTCSCGLHPSSIQPKALMTLSVNQWDTKLLSITVQGQLKIPFVVHVHGPDNKNMITYPLRNLMRSVTVQNQASVHAFDLKSVCKTTGTGVVSSWLASQWLYSLCHSPEINYEIWCSGADMWLSWKWHHWVNPSSLILLVTTRIDIQRVKHTYCMLKIVALLHTNHFDLATTELAPESVAQHVVPNYCVHHSIEFPRIKARLFGTHDPIYSDQNFHTKESSNFAFLGVWLYPTSSEIWFSFLLQLPIIHLAIRSWDPGIMSAAMQMFELPFGTHHGWDLMLLSSNQQGPSFEDSILGHDGVCDQSDYAPVAVGCSQMTVVLPMQAPWDPGGSTIPWYHIIGLRTSHTLRGRECHAPRVMPYTLHGPALWNGLWDLGLAQLRNCSKAYKGRSVQEGGHRSEMY